MTNTAIRVDHVGKLYRIGQQERYQDLRETVTQVVSLPWNYLRSFGKKSSPLAESQSVASNGLLWALRDVTFNVRQGEIVGVIGRNGAGKSTLLKVVSRITKPTSGSFRLRGRVGSLLEVGTGFHPDLTGRENIYLNGAILGMGRVEIRQKFDEIVAFAEVEKFIDTPVKRYSSGMHMRLAFAVAAHLEPEILLIDEVLAVGDASFQRKSLGKMGNVARDGRTVLFVSHNLVAIQDLCHRVLWIDEGKIVEEGDPAAVIGHYLQTSYSLLTERRWDNEALAPGDNEARLHRICVRPVKGSTADPITVATPIVIEFEYWNRHPNAYLHPTFDLYNEQGILVCSVAPTYLPDWREHTFPVGLIRRRCYIPGDLLNDGGHRVGIRFVKNDQILFAEDNALTFDVRDEAEKRDGWYGKWDGAIRPMFEWDMEIIPESQKPGMNASYQHAG